MSGNCAKAHALYSQARELVDKASFGFIGPALYGYEATVNGDPAERNRLLEEGESHLAGAISHNLAYFYRMAIEVRLAERNRPEVEALCERYLAFRPEGEPPRLHRLLAARARALALGFDDPEAGASAYAAAKADLAAAGITMRDPVELPRF
jgi:hypothetical protein